MAKEIKYTRRHLLERIGGTTAVATLMPFIPYTEAEAAQGPRLRYWSMFTMVAPKGSLQNPNLPTGDDAVFRSHFTPLNDPAVKGKISLYRGLKNKAGSDSNVSGGHGGQAAGILTGTPAIKGRVGAGSRLKEGAGVNEADSIDQFIAKAWADKGINLPLRDLRYGFNDGDVDETKTAFFNRGRMVFHEGDAKKFYDQVLQKAKNVDGTGVQPVDLTYREDILGTVLNDVNRVKRKLSAIDSRRLDNHLDAVSELQRDFRSDSMGGGGSGIACELDSSYGNANGKANTFDAFGKIVAVAFNCDITRVVSGMFCGYQFYKDVNVFDIGSLSRKIGGVYHGITHDKGGNQADRHALVNNISKWRATLFANIIKELDKFEEPTGGTVLDKTVVHWTTEHMRDHYNDDSFNMIGGGAGHFKMGKHVKCGGALQNAMLVSIANAVGFDINKFGQYDSGPLAKQYLA